MFKKEYQGGAHVDVFTAQGRDPSSQCRLTGAVKRLYDKQLHSYVYELEGGVSSTQSRIQIPKDDKNTLGLVQKCLLLQLKLPHDGRIAIEVSVIDSSGARQRINLSSSIRELSCSPLHARVPLTNLALEKWLHVCIDLESLVHGLFKGQRFKSLERVCLGGSFSLRRILTLRSVPSLDGSENFPKSCQMPAGVDHPLTHVVSYESVTGCDLGLGREERETARGVEPGGTKAPVTEQMLISKKTSRAALPTAGRQTLSARSNLSTTDNTNLEPDERSLRPHQPPDPVGLSVVRGQKKRVELLSRGKQKGSKVLLTKENEQVRESGGNGDAIGESVAMETVEPDEEELAVVDILKAAEMSQSRQGQEDVNDQVETSGVWSEDVMSETTYFYLSHPKSASNVMKSLSTETTSRGGNLDDDFVSSENDKGFPHNSDDAGPLHSTDNDSISRLSDDYDWRQYASRDDRSQQDLSLRTRLMQMKQAQQTASIELDSSLSGSASMTLSGWTERFREATAHGGALQDSLEIRDMGGTLTPALGNTLTEQPDFPVDLPGDVQANDQELDLMYDPQLNCFYDPVTNKYYELVQ